MSNKYYIPSPEEFRVGFIYESLQDERSPNEDSSWEKNTIENEWDYDEVAFFDEKYSPKD